MCFHCEPDDGTTCTACGNLIRWINCPTGGWWAHEVHPADDHDAVPSAFLVRFAHGLQEQDDFYAP